MNKVLIMLMFILGHSKLQAQEVDTLNVYFKALKIHLSEKKQFYIDNPQIKSPEEFYVEKNDYTTNKIPNIIDGLKIKILSTEDIYRLTNKGNILSLIAIRPAMWKDGNLKISVIDFAVIRTGKKYGYTNLGGNEFVIKDFHFESMKKIHGNYD